MKKELLTFDEIKTDIIESDFKRVGLFDSEGKQMVSFNNTITPLDKKLDEIEKRLKSRSTEDGIYQIRTKDHGKGSRSATFYTAVGDISGETIQTAEQPNINELIKLQAQNMTPANYDELMHSKIEAATLQVKIKALEDENKKLKETIEDLESELNELSETPKENKTQTFIENTLQTIAPLADKFLQQRDDSLKLQLMQMQQRMNEQSKAQQRQNIDEATQLHTKRQMENVKEPEQAEILQRMYEQQMQKAAQND